MALRRPSILCRVDDEKMTRIQKNSTETSTSKSKSGYKKPYLVVYGDVRELTMGVGGSNPDNGQQGPTKKGT
jgi:hypothetical protein